MEIHDVLGDKYESTLDEFRIKRLYIDAIKQDLHEFNEIKMVGAPLELCGYNLSVGKFDFANAGAFDYHIRMFNKKRYNNWTNERRLTE